MVRTTKKSVVPESRTTGGHDEPEPGPSRPSVGRSRASQEEQEEQDEQTDEYEVKKNEHI